MRTDAETRARTSILGPMRNGLIYLDNAATSWPKPPVVAEAMTRFLAEQAGNPGRGGHRLSRDAAAVVEHARDRLAALVNAPCPRRVVLTHGCTDSLNMAIHGVLRGALRGKCQHKPHVVVTTIEHNAVLRTAHCYDADHVIDLTVVPCDEFGRIDPETIAAACHERTLLVCVSHASNAVGTIQDVRTIGQRVRERSPRALLLVDAAQTAGHLPIDVQRDGVDLLAIAGHKGLRGPTGTGALFVGCRAYSDDHADERVFCERRGGTGMRGVGLEMPTELPDALEAGTANAVGFAGLLAAMDAPKQGAHEREMALTARLLDGLAQIAGVRLFGLPTTEGRTPVVLFNIEGWNARDAGAELDRRWDICVRGGVHCAPLLHQTLATGEEGAVRASPGADTPDDEIDLLLDAVAELARTPVTQAS